MPSTTLWDRVYCLRTADKALDTIIVCFAFLRDLQEKQRADERTRTADLTSSRLVATCSRRWLELEIRLPKLFALASIYPGESAPPQSHCKTFVKLFRTRLLRPSSEPRW